MRAFNAPQPKRPANKSWLTVRNESDVTEMIISGHIGASWWDDSGTTSKEFREKFSAIPKGQQVHVRINSEGGSVSDALEIYNCIQARKEDVTTFNDGYALSSASIILCAGAKAITPRTKSKCALRDLGFSATARRSTAISAGFGLTRRAGSRSSASTTMW